MDKNFTLIGLLLDRSGSMAHLAADTIGGVNSFLDQQKKVPGRAAVTLAVFDHEYDLLTSATPLEDMPPLNSGVYVPRGNTALFDATQRIVAGIEEYISRLKEEERPGQVILLIVTDGQDNASDEVSKDTLLRRIEERKIRGWQIFYIGADASAFSDASSIGAKGFAYSAHQRGTKDLYRGMGGLVGSSRMATAGHVQSQGVLASYMANSHMSNDAADANNDAFEAMLKSVARNTLTVPSDKDPK